MSHELHDDAGAVGGSGCALAHVPKVCGFMGGGNTAFRVEFLRTKDEVRGAVSAVRFSKGGCAKAKGVAFHASPPAPLQKDRGAGQEWLIETPLPPMKSRALPVLSTQYLVLSHPSFPKPHSRQFL